MSILRWWNTKTITNYMATNNTTTGDNSQQQDQWAQRELGVFWKRSKQNSKENYLVGTINLKNLGFDKDVAVVVFTNKRKQNNNHPDLRMYVSEKREDSKPATAGATNPVRQPANNTQRTTAPAATQTEQDASNELI
jgi:hypothetical protein